MTRPAWPAASTNSASEKYDPEKRRLNHIKGFREILSEQQRTPAMPVSFVVVCPVWEIKRVKVPNTPDGEKRRAEQQGSPGNGEFEAVVASLSSTTL